MNDPEQEKSDDLSARIRAAEKKSGVSAPQEEEVVTRPVKASQTGYEFAGTVIACALIGWLIDRYLHTMPWVMIGMLVLGFVVGIANVWRALGGGSSQSTEKE
jgi:ATP synthase protein I